MVKHSAFNLYYLYHKFSVFQSYINLCCMFKDVPFLCLSVSKVYNVMLCVCVQAGDPQEVGALAEVFCPGRTSPLLMGSVKSNMGHSEPASGLCAIVKVCYGVHVVCKVLCVLDFAF